MALLGGTFGDGSSTGTTAASLATILGTNRKEYRQLDVRAATGATGPILIGPSTVSATDAWVELAAGESWGLNPQSFTSPAGGDFKIAVEDIYIVGSAVADQAYVVALQ